MLLTDNPNRKIYLLDNIRYDLDDTVETLWHSRDRIEDEDYNHVPIRNDERNAIKPLLELGYKYIGTGCGRIVLRLPEELNNFVVKLSRFGNDPTSIGMWQNNNEVSFCNKKPVEDYPILPVYDWQEPHAKWLIMPYGKPMSKLDKTDIEKEKMISKTVDELSTLDILSIDELTPINFVIYNDEPVLADYGSRSYNF